jgi:hypothetical protein
VAVVVVMAGGSFLSPGKNYIGTTLCRL